MRDSVHQKYKISLNFTSTTRFVAQLIYFCKKSKKIPEKMKDTVYENEDSLWFGIKVIIAYTPWPVILVFSVLFTAFLSHWLGLT